jgi:hemoglobin
MASLYERLGELDALESVADAFVTRAAADDRINQKFARSDVPRLKASFSEQLCEATGGPCHYTARSMRDAHNGMGVTSGEFNAFMEDFAATLSDAGP